MMITKDETLRPYQTEAQEQIVELWERGVQSVMLQMPTGAGKTRLFVSLVKRLSKPKTKGKGRPAKDSYARFLIVTHREELVEQVSESLSEHYHLEHGILQGKNTRDVCRNIIVASIQSWTKQPSLIHEPNFIIIDEAHHSIAKTYQALWEAYPKAKKLGVTATPYRLGKVSLFALYDRLVLSWPMRQFIEKGYLANYRLFTVSEHIASLKKINRLTKFGTDGDYKIKDLQEIVVRQEEIDFLFDCYKGIAYGKKGLVYAVNREHAAMIAERFAAEGICAVALDSKTKSAERKQRLAEFKEGKIQVLVNVELFTEGFDCPSIEFVLLARPTRSLTMYMQQVGRALRPTPNGEPVLILDSVGLRHRFGLPDRKRDWQKHFLGERPPMEVYEKRTLGEQNFLQSMAEYQPEEYAIKPKPKMEIQPSDTKVHIYFDNEALMYGLCDDDGNVIEQAYFMELGRSPFGWYQGLCKIGDQYEIYILDKEGEYRFFCYDLQRISVNIYEAHTWTCIIRFDHRLKMLYKDCIEVNGVKVYQVSYNDTLRYAVNLDLGSGLYDNYEPCGTDCVELRFMEGGKVQKVRVKRPSSTC